MSSFFRTSVRPTMQRLTNDKRMVEIDHQTLNNVLVVLRTRLPTATLSGLPQHHDMHYVAQFDGIPGSVPYKLLVELHNVNQRLVSNVRMRSKSVVLPTVATESDCATPPPIAKLLLEVTFLYHNKTQLPESIKQLASSPHNPLIGYAHGARQTKKIGVPEAFAALPVDDRMMLSQVIHVVHHMHDNMPMVYTDFEERPVKQHVLPAAIIGSYQAGGASSSAAAEQQPNQSETSTSALEKETTISHIGSICSLVQTEYRLSFSNLDYVDSDFIDYLTMLTGARITRLTVAPHMMTVELPENALVLSDEEDNGNDGDTEDEQEHDEGGHQQTSVAVATPRPKSKCKASLQPMCIASVRLTVYMQHVNVPIAQMYGLPDESATKHMVQQAQLSTAANVRNLNVTAMWSRLTPKRKHVTTHEETDLETDNESAYRAKRVAIRP